MKLWDDIAKVIVEWSEKAAFLRPIAARLQPEDEFEEEEEFDGPRVSQWSTLGARSHRGRGEAAKVVFKHAKKGISRVIVDSKGYIRDFPGIDAEAEAKLAGLQIDSQIQFRTDFERREDGLILMIWEVQPDGRYWEDEDGFGGTNDPEISLYALIDEDGRFLGPFQLYKIGATRYYTSP